MKTVIGALFWELLWKNRVVFPALVVLLGIGAVLAQAASQAAPDAWWLNYARGSTVMAFLASILLGFAPFTLMESHSSWRMNSMTTRWFILPVRTCVLVTVPLVLAWCLNAGLVGAWTPVLNRLGRGLDLTYFLLVLILGVGITQTLAWTVPRKPGQFWCFEALLFPALFIIALAPPAMPRWLEWRASVLAGLGIAALASAALSVWAARNNRCGNWPGEVPLERLQGLLPWPRSRAREFESPGAALFWSDALPVLRVFLVSWLLLAAIQIGHACWVVKVYHPSRPINLGYIAWVGLQALPLWAFPWLVACGLSAGREPGAGFRTQFSSFRATLPITAGTVAATRIGMLALAWALVWLPLLVLKHWFQPDLTPTRNAELVVSLSAGLALKMAISAHVTVGALPLLLRGRLDGFPTLLLVSMLGWAWTWLVAGFLDVDENPGWRWFAVGLILTAKVAGAAGALIYSRRAGHITSTFAVVLVGTWLALAGSLIWLLPSWQTGGAWRGAAIAILLPLTRIALCPWAVASNRTR